MKKILLKLLIVFFALFGSNYFAYANEKFILPEKKPIINYNQESKKIGNILIPLKQVDIDALVGKLVQAGYDSIAVGLLHSYVNDSHEKMIGKALATHMPDVMVSLSSEVSPQMREYERFNTTIANAYIKPLMKSYLARLKGRLLAEGADCPVFLMHYLLIMAF